MLEHVRTCHAGWLAVKTAPEWPRVALRHKTRLRGFLPGLTGLAFTLETS